jgi:thiol-disulfide isomerase/thioredoxin
MKITVFNQLKRIITFMLTAVLLSGLSVPTLAEEQEVKTYEKAGVRVVVPPEFKDLKGVLDGGILHVLSYSPPTYNLMFSYTAMSEEDYKDYSKKVDNGEVSSEEYLEFSNSTVVDLGMFYTIKGDLTDLPDITKDGEVIELGSVDGYNSYYVIQFDADAHSNWDEEYLEEAEMLSDKIVEMLKQAEYFKPVDPAAELIGKKLTFKAEDLDHNWHTSEELFSQNRFTLVNVWGSWCGPCKSELEDLGEFHRQIEDKNCGVLGLEHEFEEYEEFAQEAKDLLKENNVTYPNVLVNDDMDSIKAFSSHPSFFFVNSEGVVVSPAFTGAVPVFDKFMPELDKLLAEEGSA